MKSILLLPIISSVIFAGVIENADGAFLEIFAGKSPQSKRVATVSTSKGQLTKKLCTNTRNNGEWCKVKYINNDVTISGYVDKISYEKIKAIPNKRKTFEISFGGDRDDVAKAILPLKDGAIIVGYTESFGAGGDDAYVMRVDKFGNKIASSAFGGGGDDVLQAVVAVDDGFLVSGTTRSFGNRIESVYLAKISPNMKMQWQNGYYSDKDDYYRGNDMIKISEKNVLIAGSEEHVQFFNSDKNCYLNSIDFNGRRNGVKR